MSLYDPVRLDASPVCIPRTRISTAMNPQEVNAPPPSAIPPAPPGRPPRRSRWLGSLLALVLVVLLGGAAWYLIQRANDESRGGGGFPGGGRPLVTVGDAVVRQAELPVIIDALGTVIPATTVTLRPQVSGMLTQVLFTEGQMVKKGQLLAQIDPRPFEQALMQAQGTRQRDEAQLENARLTLARYRVLLSQDSIARQDVDTQAALVKQLEGTVMTDKAQEGTAFRVELLYAGLFTLANVPDEQLQPFLLAEAPRLLFPFARQIVSDTVLHGGFPPFLLDPIDFAAIYVQQAAQAEQLATGETQGEA